MRRAILVVVLVDGAGCSDQSADDGGFAWWLLTALLWIVVGLVILLATWLVLMALFAAGASVVRRLWRQREAVGKKG